VVISLRSTTSRTQARKEPVDYAAPPPGDVTRLLVEWREGRDGALDQLVPIVYDELRRVAARQLRRERPDHTLQPTTLISEVYLLLAQQRAPTAESRSHFFGIAAQLMRRVLVDHARSRMAAKRGGGAPLCILDESAEGACSAGTDRAVDLLAIHEAIERLSELDADQGRIVELRFFAGLSVDEVALVMKRSSRTVKREWRMAKAWLHRELVPGRPA
jgi:RNA polymerase sigma factor (TIGR02999 family)